MKKKNSSAFTLVEVMMVVAVLALITVFGVKAIGNSIEHAEGKIRETNVEAVEAAKEQWALLNNKLDGTAVTWEDIQPYFSAGHKFNSLSDLAVGGQSITINDIGTSAAYSCSE